MSDVSLWKKNSRPRLPSWTRTIYRCILRAVSNIYWPITYKDQVEMSTCSKKRCNTIATR